MADAFVVTFDLDTHEFTDEFLRLKTRARLLLNLENQLRNMFTDMQENTHVITGSLRGSGKVESEYDGTTWVGTVGEGGSSTGFPNDPVTYANTEAERGGDHDFLRDMPDMSQSILGDIQDFLAGND